MCTCMYVCMYIYIYIYMYMYIYIYRWRLDTESEGFRMAEALSSAQVINTTYIYMYICK